MRPVRLTIQAFGPYAGREVIDFREAVESGLFGVYGQTGSGKSTIFSAMIFALFGKPAKEEQEPTSVRSDHAGAGVVTEVEFVFDIGARRFVALRRPEQMRPKKHGDGETRSPHEAFLFDATGLALDDIHEGHRGRITAEKKVGQVDAAVSDLLGYGAEQFRQIVLLPQGRFETFLSAKTRERLDILRDLFDVSAYRQLAAQLKDAAAAAELQVRQERELCARRLEAEGFESTDTLIAGIAGADAQLAALVQQEIFARTACETAETALRAAERIEAQFVAAALARQSHAALAAETPDIDRLAGRVTQAERARTLRDPEAHVTETASEVRDAEAIHEQAQTTDEAAKTKAAAAVEVLQAENARAGEVEALRVNLDGMGRHAQALEKAAGLAAKLEVARVAEGVATGKFTTAQQGVAALHASRRTRIEALKAARLTAGRRQEITSGLVGLTASLVAAEGFEKAQADAQRAKAEVDRQAAAHQAAQQSARLSLSAFEAAEQALAVAQALHLASKLKDGEPCAVCGATDHPAPATGGIEHAGRDQAFRDAKTAWLKADQQSRATAETLAGLQGTLRERQDRLTGVAPPPEGSAALTDRIRAENRALLSLGPETDIAAADTAIERLGDEIAMLEAEREGCRDTVSSCQKDTATQTARLDEMLSTVPEALRVSQALAAAMAQTTRALNDRQVAKAAAETADRQTRDTALAAQKDLQAAKAALATCTDRHRRAAATFRSRLDEAGLSEAEYRALKPAIASIDQDRATVEDHRRRLENAAEAARTADDAIARQVRPDTPLCKAQRGAAEAKLTEATNLRAGAGHRRDHLANLRDSLAETLRKLDAAESESGPLRALAGLVNGENPQKLDLETYAIGAMFDQVLGAANLRLGPMTINRYRLERDLEGAGRGRRGLGIQVSDSHTGKSRPTATLSGGETFIAALALALGLADVVESTSGKVRLDTIFIDEGFGSLDTENGSGTLDQVLQVLNALVSQNRAVGLISHVPLVQEAIPNGFYVRKYLDGSRVEARGPG